MYLPDIDDAVACNAALSGAADEPGWGGLRDRPALQSVLERPWQARAHEGQDIAGAIAVLVEGVVRARAFDNGNERTAFVLAHHVLADRGYWWATPDEDLELADLIAGLHDDLRTCEDIAALLRKRILTAPRTPPTP